MSEFPWSLPRGTLNISDSTHPWLLELYTVHHLSISLILHIYDCWSFTWYTIYQYLWFYTSITAWALHGTQSISISDSTHPWLLELLHGTQSINTSDSTHLWLFELYTVHNLSISLILHIYDCWSFTWYTSINISDPLQLLGALHGTQSISISYSTHPWLLELYTYTSINISDPLRLLELYTVHNLSISLILHIHNCLSFTRYTIYQYLWFLHFHECLSFTRYTIYQYLWFYTSMSAWALHGTQSISISDSTHPWLLELYTVHNLSTSLILHIHDCLSFTWHTIYQYLWFYTSMTLILIDFIIIIYQPRFI